MGTLTSNYQMLEIVPPASLPVGSPYGSTRTISTITGSGTTATATTSGNHGLANYDWVIIAGSDQPLYNGPYQVASQNGTTQFTYQTKAYPGASSAGLPTVIKALTSGVCLWGASGGGTPSGLLNSVSILGAGTQMITGGGSCTIWTRVQATTAPTTGVTVSIWYSESGVAGTWALKVAPTLTPPSNGEMDYEYIATNPGYYLVLFYGALGTAVICEARANELTSMTY
jgi:hypothetical protein